MREATKRGGKPSFSSTDHKLEGSGVLFMACGCIGEDSCQILGLLLRHCCSGRKIAVFDVGAVPKGKYIPPSVGCQESRKPQPSKRFRIHPCVKENTPTHLQAHSRRSIPQKHVSVYSSQHRFRDVSQKAHVTQFVHMHGQRHHNIHSNIQTRIH